jgi:hypothetical protein
MATLEPNEEKPVSKEKAQTVTATDESGDTSTELPSDEAAAEPVYPAKLTEREREDIARQACLLPLAIAQQMLDVIEAKRQAGQIRTNPAAVFGGIVRKYRADPDSFDPSGGFHVAEARRRRAEAEARARAEAERRERERGAHISPEARAVARKSLASIRQILGMH